MTRVHCERLSSVFMPSSTASLSVLSSQESDGAAFMQAIGTAADLARIHKSKVTVLVVDQPGSEGDPGVKLQVINK